MSTAKTLIAPDKSMYPISRQGAGRVQVIKAIDASLVSVPTGLSLGEITIEKKKLIRKSVSIRNFGTAARTLTLSLEADAGLSLAKAPSEVVLAPNEVKTIELEVMVDISGLPNTSSELDGILKLSEGSVEAMRIPMLAVATKVSQVKVESLVIHSTSKTDSDGAAVDLTLKNSGTNAGDAYPFNLIARDERKRDPNADPNMDHSCDLQEAGYRVIVKEGQPVLQIAGKLFEPMTTWDNCEIIALIDGDGDGIADQELAGIREDNLKGLSAKTFSSVLLDAAMTRELRKKFELESQAKKEEPKEGETKKEIVENYTAAIIALSPMLAMNHSTIAIIEAPIANLKLRNLGEVSVRIAASSKELSAIQPDDALGKDAGKWLSLNVRANGAGFADLPEKITLAPGESSSVKISKGLGSEKLLLLYPSNKPALDGLSKDQQSEIAKPTHMSEMITVSKK